jgi:hypothetical protein
MVRSWKKMLKIFVKMLTHLHPCWNTRGVGTFAKGVETELKRGPVKLEHQSGLIDRPGGLFFIWRTFPRYSLRSKF